jgi:hypothetical protein
MRHPQNRGAFGASAWALFGAVVLAPLAAAALAGPAAASGAHGAGVATSAIAVLRATSFRSPSGNIRCVYQGQTSYGPQLQCIVDTPLWANGAYGLMYADGPVAVGLVDDWGVGRTRSVLRYGQVWSRGGMSCRMTAAGITCRDRKGHGFKLSRLHQTQF